MLLKVGTRKSNLALWQTDHIIKKLQQAWPQLECQVQPFVTQGDKIIDKPLPEIGGKGLFTQELEERLYNGSIDIVVHSLKDLPVENPPHLTLGAIVGREDDYQTVCDVLVTNGQWSLENLPHGAKIGTSSLRRQAQLLHHRPDLQIESIRGNVETRIRKVHEGGYDGTVLAGAGLTRLGLEEHICHWLTYKEMLPAPGQGALAVQCRAEDRDTLALLAAIEQPNLRATVTAERIFLHSLEAGCSSPVAAYAKSNNDMIELTGLVASVDGQRVVQLTQLGQHPEQLGRELAIEVLKDGAEEILDTDRTEH